MEWNKYNAENKYKSRNRCGHVDSPVHSTVCAELQGVLVVERKQDRQAKRTKVQI